MTGVQTCALPICTSQAGNEETQLRSEQAASGGTDVTTVGPAPNRTTGKLVDAMGRCYQLKQGSNTIGRKATTSSATVQIQTTDRTMSRSHAIIEVYNQRGQIVHLLKNGANKNPSYLNGALINQFDQLILNNGDRIKMGSTELTFTV